jgi:methyl-accepting chemotaxis protein
MKLLTKQFLAFLIGSLFTLGVAGTALWGFKNLEVVTDQLLSIDVRVNALANDFARELAKSRRAEKEFFIFPDKPEKQVKYISKWSKSYNMILEDFLNELNTLLRSKGDSIKLAEVAKATNLMNENIDEWKIVTDNFIRSKSYDQVNNAEYGVFKKRTHELEDISAALIATSMEDVVESRQQLKEVRDLNEMIIKGLFVVSLIWAILFPMLFSRKMSGDIKKITKVADEISRGKIAAKLVLKRKDELGELAIAITRMQKSLMIIIRKLKGA